MDNKSRSVKSIETSIDLISNKIDEIKKWNEAIPTLTQSQEQLKWQKVAISLVPEEEVDDEMTASLEREKNYWVTVISNPAKLNPANTSASSVNTSGSYSLYEKVFAHIRVDPRSQQVLQEYQDLQRKHRIVEGQMRILAQITQIPPSVKKPPLHELYERAVAAIEHPVSGIGSMSAAGSAIRNVMIELKGHLYYYSHASKGSDWDKWNAMAEHLAKNGRGSLEYQTLLAEFSTHSTLHGDLSTLTKNNRYFSSQDFDKLVTSFFSHFEVVLNSIDLAKLT
jgi:hypothetical protein